MHSKKSKKSGRVLCGVKGFTLIEMLIVIVIIGILAAALIPRLTSARGRANDVARKADLQQIATALISYQIDHGNFPTTAGGVKAVLGGTTGVLAQGGMSSIPSDPGNAVVVNGTTGSAAGDFWYQPITKNGQSAGGVVLMATIETEGSANYIMCTGSSNTTISTGTSFDTVQSNICTSFAQGACNVTSTGACTYTNGNGELRYVYIY